MDVAIVGAAGACGRQLAVQLLEARTLHPTSRLLLVGHRGGSSENELWGLRADLEDAFIDFAPDIEVVLDAEGVRADIVVMLAGRTLSTDPTATPDRAALGRANAEVFSLYAKALGRESAGSPIVIVQSNPVELGVQIFADEVGRHRVIGAGAWSDTLRFRQELAKDFGVRRPAVTAPMLGQHGAYLVPAWSLVRARGVTDQDVAARVAQMRGDRKLVDLPTQLRELQATVLHLVSTGEVLDAYRLVESQPPDVRAAVKPFFTHYSAGHTTEVVTARAVADIVEAIVEGHRRLITAQVLFDAEWHDVQGVVGAPVLVGPDGWTASDAIPLAPDEEAALHLAVEAIATVNRSILEP